MNYPGPPFESYRLVLEPLSPVHIGSGESIEPYEYDIEIKSGTGLLKVYDLSRLLGDLNDVQRSEFLRLTEQNDFVAVRRWIRGQVQPQHQRFAIATWPALASELARQLDNPKRTGEIHLMTRNGGNGTVYIPGSSVKGAVRTAVLDAALRSSTIRPAVLLLAAQNHQDRSGTSFESLVMDYQNQSGRADIRRDPFRQLHFADLSGPIESTFVDRVKIVRHEGAVSEKPTDILMYREVTGCAIMGEQLQFSGEMQFWTALTDHGRIVSPNDRLPKTFTVQGIAAMCNEFYLPRLEFEAREFLHGSTHASQILKLAQQLLPHQCLIRLGRHSHFECVTVSEPYHQPVRGFGKSRSLLGGQLPLGWAKLTWEERAV